MNPDQDNPRLAYDYGSDSGYETELHLTAALDALVRGEDSRHPDRRFFQIVHLITEYSWVGVHDALAGVAADLDADRPSAAGDALVRARDLAAITVSCARLLLEQLPQDRFLAMRQFFPDEASGLDSPGGRNLRKVGTVVWTSFTQAVSRNGSTLDELVQGTSGGNEQTVRLAAAMSGLHRLDARLLEWKQVHLNLVWSVLGGHPNTGAEASEEERPTSLRGRPTSDLERLAVRPLFPELWRATTASFHAQAAAGAGGVES